MHPKRSSPLLRGGAALGLAVAGLIVLAADPATPAQSKAEKGKPLAVGGQPYPAGLLVRFTHQPAGGSYVGPAANCTTTSPPSCTTTGVITSLHFRKGHGMPLRRAHSVPARCLT